MQARAPAKINLALVVGSQRPDGKHEVLTLLQHVSLADGVELVLAEPGERGALVVEGFADDTLVRAALELLAEEAGVRPGWHVTIEKRIPVAAGLGGGSSDAAAALRLANAFLEEPLDDLRLEALAARLGADVPFFLRSGPQLGRGDGSKLEPVELPTDFSVLLALPRAARKTSTADVYRSFDRRAGSTGFSERRAALLAALENVREPIDLALLPQNDLASSPLGTELERLGAFRADVSGAGPTVYGLFLDRAAADEAVRRLHGRATFWLTEPQAAPPSASSHGGEESIV